MSQKYLDGTEYNAYKHGIRIITGPTYIKFTPTDNPQGGIEFTSDDSVRFLEIEEGKNNTKAVRETFKHFNPIESINHLFIMAELLETIKAVRLARLQGRKGVASLKTITKLDKDTLNKTVIRTRWSVTI